MKSISCSCLTIEKTWIEYSGEDVHLQILCTNICNRCGYAHDLHKNKYKFSDQLKYTEGYIIREARRQTRNSKMGLGYQCIYFKSIFDYDLVS